MITVEVKGLKEISRFLDPAVAKKTYVSVLNKTATQVKTKAVKTITDKYTLKPTYVKGKVKIIRARGNRLYAIIESGGFRLSLLRYGARQIKMGISVKVKKRGGRKRIASAFKETMRGNVGIFIRRRIGGGKKRYGRLPVEAITGPALPVLLGSKDVSNIILDFGGRTFERLFFNEYSWRLTKRCKTTD